MIAGSFDDGDRPGIAHRETLAGHAAEVTLAGDRAIQYGISDDDRLLRNDARVGWWLHNNASAGKSLAEIIVGVALELEGDAARQERAKALYCRTHKPRHNSVRRQALMAIALGD